MADMELSLDEIIKKRNIKTAAGTPKFGDRKPQAQVKRLSDGAKPAFPVKRGVPDARLKLLKKRKSDPGPMPDARYRLQALRTRRPNIIRTPHMPPAVVPLRRTIHGRLGLMTARHPMDVDMYEDMYDMAGALPLRDDYLGGPISRTLDNSILTSPMFGPRRPFDWDRPQEDTEDMDLVLDRMDRIKTSVRQGFRPGAPDWDDITITVKTPGVHSQPPHPILKRPQPTNAPPVPIPRSTGGAGLTLSQRFNRDRNAEASAKVEALKQQLSAAKGEPVIPKQEDGHRIIVSNLVEAVSDEDVKELFGDVGPLISAKVVRPGVAEVVFVHLDDALKAVDNYHNRHLDKQPMKCLLVKNQARKNVRQPVQLDMTALRNALHKKVPT